MKNEKEIIDILSKKYNFERYYLEEMTVAETVSLFSQAEVIVGPHGAGLTDIIFADDAAVIELFRGTANTRVYFSLAKQLDLWYGCIHGDRIGSDIEIDIRELQDTIDAAIEHTSQGN